MNKVDKYMNLPYKMEIIPDNDEGGYVASFPDLPGCITTGKDMESLIINANYAKRAWIEEAIREKIDIPILQ